MDSLNDDDRVEDEDYNDEDDEGDEGGGFTH